MLGIEINDGYICLGCQKHKKLHGFTRIPAPVSDGVILDAALLKSLITDYAREYKPGRTALLTINTSKAVLRFTKLATQREKGLLSLLKGSDLVLADMDVFPFDITGYAVDYRPTSGESALICCMPEEISCNFAELLKDIGIIPVGIGVYIDSISLALEAMGKNSVCVVPGCLIYVENGLLKELVLLENMRELETALGGLYGITIDYAYNLTNSEWIDSVLSGIGCEVRHDDTLALKALLRVKQKPGMP